MANFRHLVEYFKVCDSNTPNPPRATSQLLALSLLSSLCARVFRVDGFAPDMCLISNDDTDLIRAKLRTISKESKKLEMSFNSSIKALHIVRAAQENMRTSLVHVTTLAAIRHRSDTEQRRKVLGDMYRATGPYTVAIEGVFYTVENPASVSVVLDSSSVIRSYMTKSQNDSTMDRYIFDIAERDTNAAPAEYESKPSAEALRYLNDIIDVVHTLSSAGVVIDVEMTARARNHYDQAMQEESGADVTQYQKVKKVAALLALSRSVHDAVIDVKDVTQALEMTRGDRDCFGAVHVDVIGARSSALLERLRAFLASEYGAPGYAVGRNSRPHLHALGMVPVAHMLQMVAGLKLFTPESGETRKKLLDEAVAHLVEEGALTLLHMYHPLAMGSGHGRIFSRIAWVNGCALERVHEWKDLAPVYDV
jgi:hypothetical protein